MATIAPALETPALSPGTSEAAFAAILHLTVPALRDLLAARAALREHADAGCAAILAASAPEPVR